MGRFRSRIIEIAALLPSLLAAILCFCVSARASDISSLFNPAGIILLETGESDEETDLRETAYETGSQMLPADAEFTIGSKAPSLPVIESMEFTYPDDTPSEQRIDMVEVWALSSGDKTLYRTMYRGRLDTEDMEPRIDFTPFAARHVRVRFYHGAGQGAAVIPRIAIQGMESAENSGSLPDPEPVTFDYVAFRDDEPVGAYTVSRRALDDAGYVYEVSHSMDIVTVSPESHERQEEHYEEICRIETGDELDLYELSCEYPEESAAVRGRALGNSFMLTAQGLSSYEKKERSLSKGRYVPAMPVLIYDVMVRDGLFLGQERDFVVASPHTGKLDHVVARITDFYPAREGRADLYVIWISEKESPDFVRLALVEAGGAVLREYDYNLGLQYWMVEDPDEWEFEPLVLDFDLQVEELKRKIRDFITLPDAVERARIAITWNEVPPEVMQLESARQRLVSAKESEPGVFEAELEIIRRAPGDEPLVSSEPLDAWQLAPFLAPDDTVETGNEELRSLAQDIAGNETDPLRTASLIFNWLVHGILPHNVDSYFVPQASVVLRRRKGDCKYFAVMFATLARIRGIPTRFAFGQRYLGGTYGYHVWNQIYIDGEWLDVDASDLSMTPGALHIQLYTGASFNEKGHTGVLLGFRPEPEILDTEIGPPDYSALSGRVHMELSEHTFQDSFFNCRIQVPDPFKYELIDLGFVRKLRLYLPEQPQFIASISMFPKRGEDSLMSGGLGLHEYVHMDDLFGAMRAAKAHKFGKTDFAGGQGFFLTGEFRDRNNQFVLFDITILELEDRDIVFNYIGDSELYREFKDELSWIKKNMSAF